MEHSKHKIRIINSLKLFLLLLIFLFFVYCFIAIFITGPKYHYDIKINQQIQNIKKSNPNVSKINRHVFQYIIYIGEDEHCFYWYNEKGEQITKINKTEFNVQQLQEKINLIAHNLGIQLEEIDVKLGYGYKNPVYIIETQNFEMYLDYKDYRLIYFRKKGLKE